MTADEELDHALMPRGKYSPSKTRNPKTPSQVAETDPEYLVWAYEAWKDIQACSQLLYKDCLTEVGSTRYQHRVARDQDRD